MLIPLFLLVILGVDWASGYAIAGYVMRHGVGPYGYAFWQSIGPLCFLLIIQVVRRDLLPARGSFTYSLGCGLFGLAIPNLLIYISSRYVNSGILTIIANTASIFIYPLAILFRQEQYQLSRLLLVLIGSLGIFLLVRPLEFSLEMAFLSLRHSNSWLYLALLIPLCYAFTAVYIARFRPSS
ncbi:MAG: EamA family transporter, partial [Burkholderiales bacterium]